MSREIDRGIHSVSIPSTNTTAVSRVSTASTHSTVRSNQAESNPTKEEIEKKPWKYIGYNGYSSIIESEKDFYILRKFSWLNIRVTLALQDQVVELEEQLKELDSIYSTRNAEDLHNGSFRDDREDRKALLEEIASKLSQYNSLVLQQSELEKRPPPAIPDLKSVRNWHYNHGNRVISDEEQDFLNHEHDLISVVDCYKTPLRRTLERSRKFRTFFLWHTDPPPDLPNYENGMITYTSNKRINRFITIIIIGTGTLMLITPIWVLQSVGGAKTKLAIITTFIVVFLGLFSAMTEARPFEILAATAAYSAVLMVFLQLGSPNLS